VNFPFVAFSLYIAQDAIFLPFTVYNLIHKVSSACNQNNTLCFLRHMINRIADSNISTQATFVLLVMKVHQHL
jgi:uncharacterized membrane protein (DUF2068 family)